MAKHVDPKKHETNDKDYTPQHAGGRDAWDWAEHTNATAETQVLPKVDDEKKGW